MLKIWSLNPNYYLFEVFVLPQIGLTEPILLDISSLIPTWPILQNKPSPIPNPTSLYQRSVHKYLHVYFDKRDSYI